MNTTKTNKAIGQSSISTMTVAEVRRALSFIRKAWEEQNMNSKKKPLYLSDNINTNITNTTMSIEKFSLLFVLAHHTRRLSSKNTQLASNPLAISDPDEIVSSRQNADMENSILHY